MSRNLVSIPPEPGICDICEGKPEIGHLFGDLALKKPAAKTTLRFRDESTGQKFGECCHAAMTFTDHMLDVHGRKAGIDHPQPSTSN